MKYRLQVMWVPGEWHGRAEYARLSSAIDNLTPITAFPARVIRTDNGETWAQNDLAVMVEKLQNPILDPETHQLRLLP